ncbi:MAG: hypothetical protein QOE76_1652 [Frankiales bacterium]|jgi:hypothetical protein|nr:hypothetical protein [Frankiales bacterium]MDX6243929.1 hypothetical protein [Frankiales bacterium]
MSRRVSLPGAAELFRVTGDAEPSPEPSPAATAQPPRQEGAVRAVEPVHEPRAGTVARPAPSMPTAERDDWEPAPAARTVRRRRPAGVDRRPTGRERHEEKITVYCSAEELIDLEQARLTLRGEFGMAVDRGRIVREAIAVVIADLEAKGEASILLRRLRGI